MNVLKAPRKAATGHLGNKRVAILRIGGPILSS